MDANVLVSAVIVRPGKSGKILRSLHWVQLLISDDILGEVARVLHYPRIQKKYSLSEQDITEYLAELRQRCELVPIRSLIAGVSADPDDEKYLACGVDGDADYLVSGDPHLLDIEEYKGIKIVSPSTFLSLFEQEP